MKYRRNGRRNNENEMAKAVIINGAEVAGAAA
jgi:hypothetical protein